MKVGVYSVLYTNDMEPITILELSPWARDFLEEKKLIRLAVIEPICCDVTKSGDSVPNVRTVTIRTERFVRNGACSLMLFTDDDENALLLRSAFLPGQRRELKNERAKAFGKGFLEALYAIGR